MKKNIKLKKFLDELASDSPTPGGGSAAAVVANIAISLSLMASKISVNRRSFNKLTQTKQKKAQALIEALEGLREEIYKQADEDIRCFDAFMVAYKSKNAQEIKKATKRCFNSPYDLAKLSIQALGQIEQLDEYIVDSVKSDQDMAHELLKAVLKSCKINMKINLTKYIDAASKKKYQSICRTINKQIK